MLETTLEEQQITLKTVQALEDFSRDESLEDDAKVWITKKEAYLLWSLIIGLLHKAYSDNADVYPKQQRQNHR